MAARKQKKWLLLVLGIVLPIVGAIRFFLIPAYLDHQLSSSFNSAEEQEAFERWITDPVHIPPDALKTPEFSQETIDLAYAFFNEYSRLEAKLGKPGLRELADTLQNTGDAVPADSLEVCEAAGDLFEELVMRPDYELDVWAQRDPDKPAAIPDMCVGATRLGHRVLCARTERDWKQGRHDAALAGITPMLRTSLCARYSMIFEKMLATVCLSHTLETCRALQQDTSDPALQTAIREAIAPYYEPLQCVRIPEEVDVVTVDQVGWLRNFSERPKALNNPDLTGYELMILAQQVSSSDPSATQAEKDVALPLEKAGELLEQSEVLRNPSWHNACRRSTGMLGACVLYIVVAPGPKKMESEIDKTFALYDELLEKPTEEASRSQSLR